MILVRISAITLCCLMLNACSLFGNTSYENRFSEYTTAHLHPNLLEGKEADIASWLNTAQSHILKNYPSQKLQLINRHQIVYLHHYSILNAVYSEFLHEKHCPELSDWYHQEAENVMLNLLQLDPDDSDLAYNLSLFYARTSLFYENIAGSKQRITLLNKALDITLQLQSDDSAKQMHRFLVQSELLLALQKENQNIILQQQLIDELQPKLEQLLTQPDDEYDVGNFIILVLENYWHQSAKNPKQAEQWLKHNQQNILNYLSKPDATVLSASDQQRHHILYSEMYALLNMPQQAMQALQQRLPSDVEAESPAEIQTNKNLNKIRESAEFIQWFKQYSVDYQHYKQQHPEICQSSNTLQPDKTAHVPVMANAQQPHEIQTPVDNQKPQDKDMLLAPSKSTAQLEKN